MGAEAHAITGGEGGGGGGGAGGDGSGGGGGRWQWRRWQCSAVAVALPSSTQQQLSKTTTLLNIVCAKALHLTAAAGHLDVLKADLVLHLREQILRTGILVALDFAIHFLYCSTLLNRP